MTEGGTPTTDHRASSAASRRRRLTRRAILWTTPVAATSFAAPAIAASMCEPGSRTYTIPSSGATNPAPLTATLTVPDGVRRMTYTVTGGSGGGVGAPTNLWPGAQGSTVTGTFSVTPGETLAIIVGQGGATRATGGTGVITAGQGFRNGGKADYNLVNSGGTAVPSAGTNSNNYWSGAGGGGSSAIVRCSAAGTPVVVAAGGGGAGATFLVSSNVSFSRGAARGGTGGANGTGTTVVASVSNAEVARLSVWGGLATGAGGPIATRSGTWSSTNLTVGRSSSGGHGADGGGNWTKQNNNLVTGGAGGGGGGYLVGGGSGSTGSFVFNASNHGAGGGGAGGDSYINADAGATGTITGGGASTGSSATFREGGRIALSWTCP